MRSVDTVGYLASALVLITFYMKDMVPLRIAAICSNIAFLAYGGGLHLAPVIFLHSLLLPLNLWRLTTALDYRSTADLMHGWFLSAISKCSHSVVPSSSERGVAGP